MSHNQLEVNTLIESILFYDDDLWPKQDMSGPGMNHLSNQNNIDIQCEIIFFKKTLGEIHNGENWSRRSSQGHC